MTLVAIFAGSVCDGLASEHPLRSIVTVAAFGEIDNLAAISFHKRDVGIVPATDTNIVGQQPAAVGTPFKSGIAVGITVIILTFKRSGHLFVLEIHHAESRTVFKECHFLAIGAVGREKCGLVALIEWLLNKFGSIEQRFFIRVLDLSGKQLPQTVALAVVDKTAAVRSEIHSSFLGRSVSDAAGGIVFSRSHIYIATEHECYKLTVRRHGKR